MVTWYARLVGDLGVHYGNTSKYLSMISTNDLETGLLNNTGMEQLIFRGLHKSKRHIKMKHQSNQQFTFMHYIIT